MIEIMGFADNHEQRRTCQWRRGRDSNPRDDSSPTPLAGARLRPLGHLSADRDTRVATRIARAFLEICAPKPRKILLLLVTIYKNAVRATVWRLLQGPGVSLNRKKPDSFDWHMTAGVSHSPDCQNAASSPTGKPARHLSGQTRCSSSITIAWRCRDVWGDWPFKCGWPGGRSS